VLGKKMVIFTFDLYNPDDKATYPGYDMMVRTTSPYHDGSHPSASGDGL
jgi:hypothetical protein